MRIRTLVVATAILGIAALALAVEPGQAAGTLTVGNEKIALNYSYAIDRQRNEFNNRRDDIRIIATDKPLPEGTDLANIESAFPDGVFGVVACIDNKRSVSHVLMQFSTGMFDAGYFGPGDEYAFSGKIENGHLAGHLSSKTIPTSTTNVLFEVDVNAPIK